MGTSLKVAPVSEIISGSSNGLDDSIVDISSFTSTSSAFYTPGMINTIYFTMRIDILAACNQILINKTPIKHANPDVSPRVCICNTT